MSHGSAQEGGWREESLGNLRSRQDEDNHIPLFLSRAKPVPKELFARRQTFHLGPRSRTFNLTTNRFGNAIVQRRPKNLLPAIAI